MTKKAYVLREYSIDHSDIIGVVLSLKEAEDWVKSRDYMSDSREYIEYDLINELEEDD